MAQLTLVIAMDLGTSTATASHVQVRDTYSPQGVLHREKLATVCQVADWPGCIEGATGNECVPTDLIYERRNRQLLFWGFDAQYYLDQPMPELPLETIFAVENIKLLLPDPSASSPNSAQYSTARDSLIAALGKQPEDVFQDFMDQVVNHTVNNAGQKYWNLKDHKFELILAFPSGWPDYIHTSVARVGARALKNAITINSLENVTFGLENVYTVSETVCGIKEWLRESVSGPSLNNRRPQTANLDELEEGDYFLPVDIGGGTGCLTPLKLITKNPLAVQQLDRTHSLEASGAEVEAEFERWLRKRVTKKDYPGDMELLIRQVCRKFKAEKKKCGVTARLGSSTSQTWSFEVRGLRVNDLKGFEKHCMRLDRRDLDKCFDPMIDKMQKSIENTMLKFPSIKAIVFLGQFGGTSAYLKKRMAEHDISKQVKVRHSLSGKLDVVKGAIAERLNLEETFVRKSQTLKSYGTLVAILYAGHMAKLFPSPQASGGFPFEKTKEGNRLKVIEWAVPKGAELNDSRSYDIGRDSLRFHTWPFDEKDLGFEDIIVVSDEAVPPPQLQCDGTSYTLWTEAHEKNQLYIDGQRVQVQQIPFYWDLNMSQKVDSDGNNIGPYELDDLPGIMTGKRGRGKRREHLRRLDYRNIWEITEMQVKLHVQAIFPNQKGPSIPQLAKERELGVDEKIVTGESRSRALGKDIEISQALEQVDCEAGEDGVSEDSDEMWARSIRLQIVEDLVLEHTRQEKETQFNTFFRESPQSDPEDAHDITPAEQLAGEALALTPRQQEVQQEERVQAQRTSQMEDQQGLEARPLRVVSPNAAIQRLGTPQNARNTSQHQTSTSPNSFRVDGLRHEGCYTCKDRKSNCDCRYTFDEASGTQKCHECLRLGIVCEMAEPELDKDTQQKKVQQLERRKVVESGKRKVREESVPSEVNSRDRSMTAVPAEHQMPMHQQTPHRAIEGSRQSTRSQSEEQSLAPVRRGSYTAIRGRKHGLKHKAH